MKTDDPDSERHPRRQTVTRQYADTATNTFAEPKQDDHLGIHRNPEHKLDSLSKGPTLPASIPKPDSVDSSRRITAQYCLSIV